MDVNETLRQLREQVRRFQSASTYEDEGASGALIVDHFAGLDEWLSKGGALPSDWNANR